MFSGVIEQIGGIKQVKTLRYVKEVELFLFFLLKARALDEGSIVTECSS